MFRKNLVENPVSRSILLDTFGSSSLTPWQIDFSGYANYQALKSDRPEMIGVQNCNTTRSFRI